MDTPPSGITLIKVVFSLLKEDDSFRKMVTGIPPCFSAVFMSGNTLCEFCLHTWRAKPCHIGVYS